MTEQDWDSGFGKCVMVFLNGDGITEADSRGERVTDDSFLLCLNAHYEDIEVTLPGPAYGARVGDRGRHRGRRGDHAVHRRRAWWRPSRPSWRAARCTRVPARSVLVLQRTERRSR